MVQFLCLCLILVHTIFGSLPFCFITKIEATDTKKLGDYGTPFSSKGRKKMKLVKVCGFNGKKMAHRSL